MQAYFNKQAADIEKSFAKIEERQNKAYGSLDETATQHAELIVAETQKAVAAQDKAAQAAEQRAVREQAAMAMAASVNPQPPQANPQPPQANPQRWRGKPRLPRLPLRGPPRLWGSLAVDLQVLYRGHWYLT